VTAVSVPVVHVVEDDDASRTSTVRALEVAGHAVRAYASAAEFLARVPDEAGCIVLDLQLPGPSGLELQERLISLENDLPVVFVSGHGDVPKTAHAMKAGAVDFLAKPVDVETLLDAVRRALVRDGENRAARARRLDARSRYERLTAREREVFAHVISGELNKQIAYALGTSEHTVKVHRGRVMEKLEADSVAALVRLAAILSIPPAGGSR
jgi:FixJ family two-component response regulator